MKKIFTAAFLFLTFLLTLSAQSYINKRQPLNYLATVFTGVAPTDSCLFIKGIFTDSAFIRGSFFAKFDLNGQLLWRQELKSPEAEISAWRTELLNDNNTFLFAAAKYNYSISLDTPEISCIIYKFNEVGDLLDSISIFSPYAIDTNYFIFPRSLKKLKGGGYLLGGNIDLLTPTNTFLAKFTPSLGLEWMRTFGVPFYDGCLSVAEDAKGQLYMGGSQFEIAFSQNMVNRHVLRALDSTGVKQWEWLYPEISYPTGGSEIASILPLDDGSLICGTAVTLETYVNESTNFVETYPAIFKMNPDRSIAWWNTMGNKYYNYSIYSSVNRMFVANEQDGYIASIPEKSVKIPEDSIKYQRVSVIEKISFDGDSIWWRPVYHHSTVPGKTRCETYDMQPATDKSGYWMVGQVVNREFVPEEISQQGWIVFVDNYGCMVPGCHEVSASQAVPMADKLLVYPNPASSMLSIYHGGHTFSKGRFQWIDGAGRVISTWQAPLDDLTTTMEIGSLPSGIYFLQYTEAGIVRASKQVVVQGRD